MGYHDESSFPDEGFRPVTRGKDRARGGEEVVRNRAASLRRQAEELLVQADAYDERARELARRPLEPYKGQETEWPATVIFEKQFNEGGTVYTYAAVRATGLWFLTGYGSGRGMVWADLLEKIYGDAFKVRAWVICDVAGL